MLRSRLLSAGRLSALAIFVAVVTVLAVYLSMRNRDTGVSSDRPKLHGKVVAVFNNTRYAHEVQGRIRYVLTAGSDKTYENGSHELEQVRLESHGPDTGRVDVVTADRANISDTTDLNKLSAEFISNVMLQTSEGLIVRTNYLRYDQTQNSAHTNDPVQFEFKTFSGRCVGLVAEASTEQVHLLHDVDVIIKPQADGGQADEPDSERAARKARKRARKAQQQEPQSASGQTASMQSLPFAKKSAEETRIVCESAVIEKKAYRLTLSGAASITRARDEVKASQLVAHLDESYKIKHIEARGNSYLREDGNAEISSTDMEFFFDDTGRIDKALASGSVYTKSLGKEPFREAWAEAIEVEFTESKGQSALDMLRANGKAIVKVHPAAPKDSKTNPTLRQLSADSINLKFLAGGEAISNAEAAGNAILTVTPLRAERGADKKTIRAPSMNAVFFEAANRMKTFAASGGVRVEIEATVAEDHPPRISTSDRVSADFAQDSQDVDRIEQTGNFRYNEGERNGIAEHAVYDGRSEMLALRGSRPTVWDNEARTQADQIDYDRSNDETHARGDVRTTYYSRESSGDSTPFKNSKSPIFVTADKADARNNEGIAVYTGNARGWQDNNFVRGDRIELHDKDKRMVAIGRVESALYDVKQRDGEGDGETVPAFATSDLLIYSDTERLVHYEGNVKARQGADRVEAVKVDVYLEKEANEIDRLVASGNVVMIQPGRRGTGDELVYTAVDGRAILTGKSARVEDAEKGSTMGPQLTFYSRDDKIVAENREGTGRIRSTHRVKRSKENR